MKDSKTFYGGLPLRWKLFFSYTTLSILTMAILGAVVYSQMESFIENKLHDEMNKTTDTIIDMIKVAAKVSTKNYVKSLANEANIDLMSYYQMQKEKVLSEERAKVEAYKFIKNRKNGGANHIIISENGTFYNGYMGVLKRVASNDKVLNLLQKNLKKNGYYEFKVDNKEIIVYNLQFNPWNLKISVVGSRNEFIKLMDIEDFRPSISSLRFIKTGYAFLIHKGSCTITVHPKFKSGTGLLDLSSVNRRTLGTICETKSGIIRYPWKNPGDNRYYHKTAIFKYIPEYDWILGGSIYNHEIMEPLDTVKYIVFITFSVSMLLILLLSFLISNKITERLKSADNVLKENLKLSSIARTTQMLAHDVRKPFTLLEVVLGKLNRIKSYSDITKLVKSDLPIIRKSLVAVNGMIDDVMEIDRSGDLRREPTNFVPLINSCLRENFQIYQDKVVDIHYDLRQRAKLDVVPLKVSRVFSNILSNALQAMNQNGKLFLSTKEAKVANKKMIKIVIGNNGPKIPKQLQKRLFDAFFTKGKSAGTGLGLAIAKKVVKSHGGEIWCESPGKIANVEFHITLPSVNEMETNMESNLPSNSREYIENLNRFENFIIDGEGANEIDDPKELELEDRIFHAFENNARPLTIVVIDDESIYRNAIKELVNYSDRLKDILFFKGFKDASAALNDETVYFADYIICDIDMGPGSINGFEFTSKIREKGYTGKICIHSNRCLPEDLARASKVGANHFLPKPMSRACLLKFVSNFVEHKKGEASSENGAKKKKFRIALLEDENIYMREISRGLTDAEVLSFKSPSCFFRKIAMDRDFVSSLDGIITDNYFDGCEIEGIDLGKKMKQYYGFKKPIILVSNGCFADIVLTGAVDLALTKRRRKWELIVKLYNAKRETCAEATAID